MADGEVHVHGFFALLEKHFDDLSSPHKESESFHNRIRVVVMEIETTIGLVLPSSRVQSCINIQSDFGLEALPKEEAWNLVVKMVGDSLEGSNFEETASKIVENCAGLPISLVAVFTALRGKSLKEWQVALRQLGRPSRRNLTKMQSIIHSCIELSYDHLESQEVKDFFLLCTQMPYSNSCEDLLTVFYGLDLFSGINTLAEAGDNICILVRCLKDYGLLQDCSPMLDCPQRCEHIIYLTLFERLVD